MGFWTIQSWVTATQLLFLCETAAVGYKWMGTEPCCNKTLFINILTVHTFTLSHRRSPEFELYCVISNYFHWLLLVKWENLQSTSKHVTWWWLREADSDPWEPTPVCVYGHGDRDFCIMWDWVAAHENGTRGFFLPSILSCGTAVDQGSHAFYASALLLSCNPSSFDLWSLILCQALTISP